ncbi:hypothetical protein [Botrimarina sp.]|uniref:hypothetical protein n=1 Tax=Botrimarina sp. TaxID=2795802 RepID=UPI0032EAF1AF
MHAVAKQLDEALSRLDAAAAARLEQTVRDAVAEAAEHAQPNGATAGEDANGWPTGYFDSIVGALSDDPFDPSEELPLDPPAVW